jgi:fructosamine-3-kinase
MPNEPCDTWAEFYSTQRLLPLARLATDAGALSNQAVAGLESIADRLAELGGPPEPAARLHGDLWAGNRIVDRTGRSWLIDPACHGGHREFDLAMMRLFGGFSERCHLAYHEATPLADGWEERVALHQLAPLVVHAIKFGGGYVGAATEAIARYR